MTATETSAVPGANPEVKLYVIRPPDGGQFLAWSPERVYVSGDDDLAATASWDLIGIDEAETSY